MEEVKNIFNKKNSFGQKRPCVLREFVPWGVFFQSRGGGGSLKYEWGKSAGHVGFNILV